MAKKVIAIVKLQIQGAKAMPAPPVGPALGQHGVNIMEFCKKFNAKTQEQKGTIIPVVISIYADRTFSFVLRVPPVAVMIKETLGIEKGAGNSLKEVVGKLTKSQVKKIAEKKLKELTAADIDAAMRTVMGTARSMGVEIAE
ncbi:50S ribosomal protein L11 [Candidatus Riflebacteria bacterium]